MRGLILAVILVGSLSFGSNQSFAAILHLADFVELTDLGAGVKPTAINNNGVVVGQGADGKAFKWTNGNMTSLGTLGGTQSYANDINDSNVIVGWSFDSAGKQKSFKYDSAFTNLDSSTTLQGAAEAINSNGDIVGWRTTGTTTRSTRWNLGNPNGQILFTGSGTHKALGINDDGVMVGVTVGTSPQGFYWDGIGSPSTYTGGLGSSYLP